MSSCGITMNTNYQVEGECSSPTPRGTQNMNELYNSTEGNYAPYMGHEKKGQRILETEDVLIFKPQFKPWRKNTHLLSHWLMLSLGDNVETCFKLSVYELIYYLCFYVCIDNATY